MGKARRSGPFELGGVEGDRTLDLRIANATLSQLSYFPNQLILAKSMHRNSRTAFRTPNSVRRA